jgi:8-oxo-dGTP diphosphatase
MPLPYKIATLLYCFDKQDRVLLMERNREPNKGLWSPCGGKLDTQSGESPYACACREAAEEIGLELTPADLHLFAVISEAGYMGQAHWLMFLFEVKPRMTRLPPPHEEGRFEFFARHDLAGLKMPATDVEQIWPLVWKYRHGFFAAHCKTLEDAANQWLIEETRAS